MSDQTPETKPRISIVVPVRNEQGNVEKLVGEIEVALSGLEPFEIIYVNDGSTDGTAAEIDALRRTRPHLRQVRHAQSCGQSAAVRTGVRAARADIVATLDG
ncbi:MAG: glycosyltransferase family 2 protein, partial [Beijerinckiaceae bacterium]